MLLSGKAVRLIVLYLYGPAQGRIVVHEQCGSCIRVYILSKSKEATFHVAGMASASLRDGFLSAARPRSQGLLLGPLSSF